jgi:hypothetical protein
LKPNFTKIKMTGNPENGMLSPDGKKNAIISDGDVWIVPVSGRVNPYITGEPKRLTRNFGAGLPIQNGAHTENQYFFSESSSILIKIN